MKRVSAKRRAQQADVPPEYTELVETTRLCEWCFRRVPLEDHHVAQGFRAQTLYDIRFILRLCKRCHTDIHALPGEHGRACGIALLVIAARGDPQWFYDLTGRDWPDYEVIDIWLDRLTRDRRAWQ